MKAAPRRNTIHQNYQDQSGSLFMTLFHSVLEEDCETDEWTRKARNGMADTGAEDKERKVMLWPTSDVREAMLGSCGLSAGGGGWEGGGLNLSTCYKVWGQQVNCFVRYSATGKVRRNSMRFILLSFFSLLLIFSVFLLFSYLILLSFCNFAVILLLIFPPSFLSCVIFSFFPSVFFSFLLLSFFLVLSSFLSIVSVFLLFVGFISVFLLFVGFVFKKWWEFAFTKLEQLSKKT